jgi:NADH-quinone oxidoreductase subunit C
MCLDLTAVDYLSHPGAHLPAAVSRPSASRWSSPAQLPTSRPPAPPRAGARDDPTVPTLFELHPGTEAMEREVFDLFGIVFTDHPDLTRILLPEDWHGHPLRKDYAVGRIPVQFKDAPSR